MNRNMNVNRNPNARRPQTAKKRPGNNGYLKYILIGVAALLLVAVIVIIIVAANNCSSTPGDGDFANVNETVYIYSDQNDDGLCDGKCNQTGEPKVQATLYLQPSKEGTTRTLTCGTELVRTGILIEDSKMGYGWSRVEYNGETLYVRNSCVTTTKPHTEPVNDGEAAG